MLKQITMDVADLPLLQEGTTAEVQALGSYHNRP